jgi:Undecaprenyl-phosphate glucose phosphotransferase
LSLLITFVSVFFLFLVKEELYTRNFIFLIGLLILISISLRTLFFKGIFKFFRHKGKSIRNLLIVGAGEIGEKFRNVVIKNPEFGYKFTGFISNNPAPNVIGDISSLDKIINEKEVEEVVIALPNSSVNHLEEIVRICNKNAVGIHIIPDYFKFLSNRFQISTISNFPVITIRDEPLNEVMKRFIKRVFDILFSLVIASFILSWFIPLISIIIKLDSIGPAFFIQERIGVRRKPFRCYKFRTLVHAEKKIEAFELVVKEDPRVTRVGKILRKTNLDELPQFLNVFKGDMSVVGPRPHPFGFEKAYEKVFEEIKMRYTVRPGITGWAQINGLRGDVKDEEENKRRILERMKYDLWYIENWSFKLDFQIILITIWHMIKGDTKGI